MSVGRAALLIAVLTAASRVLGFVREAVYAAIFGAGPELDAFLVAQGVPNLVITLIASAVVTSAIPVLSGQLGRGERHEADRTFNAVFTMVLTALIAAAVAAAVAARPLIELTAPGFEPDQLDLAVDMARVLLLGSAFVASMNLLAGLLQAHRQFFWPAILGIPFNLVMIAVAAIFGGEFGVIALAVGFVIASAVRVGFEVPGLRRIRFRPRFVFSLHDPGVRLILAMAPLVLVGNSVGNVNAITDRLVGSLEGDGVISALNYAFRLIILPHGLLALALLQAVYPALGEAGGRDEPRRLQALLDRGLMTLALALLPLAAGCVALNEPLVATVYGRGEFDAADIDLTAKAVAFYAPVVLLLGWRELLARAFYALGDARTPLLAALIAMAVNVVGDVTLGRAFGIAGIAGSTSLSLAVGFGLLAAGLRRRGQSVDIGRVLLRTLAVLAVAAVAGVAMATLAWALELAAALELVVAGAAGLLLYAVMVRAVAPAETVQFVASMRDAAGAVRRRPRD